MDNTQLFTLLDTIVSSLFENKSNLSNASHIRKEFNLELMLKKCIYREKECTISGISTAGNLLVMSSEKEQIEVSDDLSLLWPHLQPQ